jgi:3-hydroxyisobutyrate dehydrogenase-like beta-hydroxyacid dehydrogenase
VSSPRPSVGFIGLGTMGEPMAANVARSGQPLTVIDVRSEPMDRLVALGAKPAASLAALAAACDVILVAVVDEPQLDAVLLGPDGVFASARPGTVVVVHSTVGPAACLRLDAEAAPRGVVLLDAPITGGPSGAVAGTLSILVGGSSSALERCRPALAAMSREIFHLGGVGAGQLAKVANNAVLAVTLHAVDEVLRLADAVGLGRQAMLDVLCSGSGESWVARNWGAIGASANAYPGGADGVAKLTRKDLTLALATADAQGIALPFTTLAAQGLEQPYRAAAKG